MSSICNVCSKEGCGFMVANSFSQFGCLSDCEVFVQLPATLKVRIDQHFKIWSCKCSYIPRIHRVDEIGRACKETKVPGVHEVNSRALRKNTSPTQFGRKMQPQHKSSHMPCGCSTRRHKFNRTQAVLGNSFVSVRSTIQNAS